MLLLKASRSSCELALVTSCDTDDISECEWYIDSGATNHMTFDLNLLSDVVYNKTPTPVFLGDKSVVLSHAEGKMRLKTACLDGTCLALKKVLFVPKLVKNLLSVRTHAWLTTLRCNQPTSRLSLKHHHHHLLFHPFRCLSLQYHHNLLIRLCQLCLCGISVLDT